MAGAMRKMAVYLGLVEDDGYDGPGFDPDDEFEPEPEPERDRRRHEPLQSHDPLPKDEPAEPVRVMHPPAQRERE
jgi:cell division inhibitor SepF